MFGKDQGVLVGLGNVQRSGFSTRWARSNLSGSESIQVKNSLILISSAAWCRLTHSCCMAKDRGCKHSRTWSKMRGRKRSHTTCSLMCSQTTCGFMRSRMTCSLKRSQTTCGHIHHQMTHGHIHRQMIGGHRHSQQRCGCRQRQRDSGNSLANEDEMQGFDSRMRPQLWWNKRTLGSLQNLSSCW